MAIVSLIALIYRVIIICVPWARVKAIRSHCQLANDDALQSVVTHYKIGDWFVLSLLSKNLDPMNFRDLIIDLYKRIDSKAAENI